MTYPFVIPNFQPTDTGSRPLDAMFLLDSRLGNSRGVRRYSDGVRHAAKMLASPDERRTFIRITQILAFEEMLNVGIGRIRPIGDKDISDLIKI